MVIDHIGLVVRDLNKGIAHWEAVFGYHQATEIIINKRQMVKVVFLEKNNSVTVKLTEPASSDSKIFRYAQKGGGVHHICFRCKNIGNELDRLKNLGLRILDEAQPGEAFGDMLIAFVYAKHGLNIELIDTTYKAQRIKSINQQNKILQNNLFTSE